MSEREIDFLMSRNYELSPKDPNSIARAVSRFLLRMTNYCKKNDAAGCGSHYRSGRVDHWLKIKNPGGAGGTARGRGELGSGNSTKQRHAFRIRHPQKEP